MCEIASSGDADGGLRGLQKLIKGFSSLEVSRSLDKNEIAISANISDHL